MQDTKCQSQPDSILHHHHHHPFPCRLPPPIPSFFFFFFFFRTREVSIDSTFDPPSHFRALHFTPIGSSTGLLVAGEIDADTVCPLQVKPLSNSGGWVETVVSGGESLSWVHAMHRQDMFLFFPFLLFIYLCYFQGGGGGVGLHNV